MNTDGFERIPTYSIGNTADDQIRSFLDESGNSAFRRSRLTYISLTTLLLIYPAVSVIFAEDPASLTELLNEGLLLICLLSTIFIQWLIFLMIFVTAFREQTGLRGLGLKRLRAVDFAWAVAFLLTSNLILAGLAWFLAEVGLPMPGEIALLIPTDTTGRIVWVAVSATAGFCEEIGFRGYLMTRLRILGKTRNWLAPTILSALSFGICHAYQGVPGLIIITIYGLMFSLLYLRTGTLWPCIIAHFFQDFGALFFPQ